MSLPPTRGGARPLGGLVHQAGAASGHSGRTDQGQEPEPEARDRSYLCPVIRSSPSYLSFESWSFTCGLAHSRAVAAEAVLLADLLLSMLDDAAPSGYDTRRRISVSASLKCPTRHNSAGKPAGVLLALVALCCLGARTRVWMGLPPRPERRLLLGPLPQPSPSVDAQEEHPCRTRTPSWSDAPNRPMPTVTWMGMLSL